MLLSFHRTINSFVFFRCRQVILTPLIIIIIIYAFSYRNPFSREQYATPTSVAPATAPLSSATSQSTTSLVGPLPVAHKQRNIVHKESSPAAMTANASVVAEPAKTSQRHTAAVRIDAGMSQPITIFHSRPVNVRDPAVSPSLVPMHPLAAMLRDK
jgi:hypothetical protein